MTNQEAFDLAYSGVIKQGVPAEEKGRCKYITNTGLSCGVGHILPTNLMRTFCEDPRFGSGGSISHIMAEDRVPGLRQHLSGVSLHLLARLQRAHDHAARDTDYAAHSEDFIASFKQRMQEVARDYDLQVPQ